MKKSCSIIIPTWNNSRFLDPCVISIIQTGVLQSDTFELVIVNNGSEPVQSDLAQIPGIRVLTPGENLGWEGGLQYGLDNSDSDFVCFQNDDTMIPRISQNFYFGLLHPFRDSDVGAVGPVTTVAAGIQSIFNPLSPRRLMQVPWLIFFTVMLRRSDLAAVGGIDRTLPGGDDFDLSFRLRKAGKILVVNPDAFLIHHGFKTGERVHGDPGKKGGWNSQEMTDNTNAALIKKHGFKSYMDLRGDLKFKEAAPSEDMEARIIRTMVNGDSAILELGCGPTKTIPRAIGIDRVPAGEIIPHLSGQKSVADIVADVRAPLPFEPASQDVVIARHILEHCVDSVNTLRNWGRVLKPGGMLIVAVPDENIVRGIPLNPEHVHAFTEESLSSLMGTLGFRTVESMPTGNGISFVGKYQKC